MLNENNAIRQMVKHLPRSEKQLNQVFEADAEMVPFGNATLAVTIDEFSDEDQFITKNPYVLGWNMAVGAISDILASGAVPVYYAHSMTVSEDWGSDYLERLSEGVGDVLRAYGAYFIGGDFGQATAWRYTATVLGQVGEGPLKRSQAQAGDAVYMTGEAGAGNLQAAVSLYKDHPAIEALAAKAVPRFSVRLEEARLIHQYARCCIDTSDGLLNGLRSLAEASGVGFELDRIPFLKSGIVAARLLKLPELLLMAGECGEYELLFTVPQACEEAFRKALAEKNLRITRIGEVVRNRSIRCSTRGTIIDFSDFSIEARGYGDHKAYLRDVMAYIEHNTVSR